MATLEIIFDHKTGHFLFKKEINKNNGEIKETYYNAKGNNDKVISKDKPC